MSHNKDNYFEYLPIQNINIDWGLYLTGIGCATVAPGADYPPEQHPALYHFQWKTGRTLPEYQIVMISEGRGIFESSATGTLTVECGQAIILFPGLWHRYRPDPKTGWKEHWISLNGEYPYQLNKRGVLDARSPIVNIAEPEEVLAVHQRIHHLLAKNPGNSLVLSACAMELLAQTISTITVDEKNAVVSMPTAAHQDEVVAQAVQMIWNHGYRSFTVGELVQRLPTTRRTLERRFQQVLGYSIGKELERCRLTRAKHLLRHTTLPITHIALAVGFSGADRLAKAFQRREKMTPGQYRKTAL